MKRIILLVACILAIQPASAAIKACLACNATCLGSGNMTMNMTAGEDGISAYASVNATFTGEPGTDAIVADVDPSVYNISLDVTIPRGVNGTGDGTGTGDHHLLTNLTDGDDHTQYLYLPGRTGAQNVTGSVSIENRLMVGNISKSPTGYLNVIAPLGSTTRLLKLGGYNITNPFTTTDADTQLAGYVGVVSTSSGGLMHTGFSNTASTSSTTSGLIFRGYVGAANTTSPGVEFRAGKLSGTTTTDMVGSEPAFAFGSSTGTTNYATIKGNGDMNVTNEILANKITIGTLNTGPGIALDVNGSARFGNDRVGSTNLAVDRQSNLYGATIKYLTAGVNDWVFGERGTSDSDFHIYSYGISADALNVNRSTGNVGLGNKRPYEDAILELNSTTKAFLPPRTVPGSIATPVEGMVIYDTNNKTLSVRNDSQWMALGTGGGGGSTLTKSQICEYMYPMNSTYISSVPVDDVNALLGCGTWDLVAYPGEYLTGNVSVS